MKKILLVINSMFIMFCVYSQEINYRLNGQLEIDHISYFKYENNKLNNRNQGSLNFNFKSSFKNKIYWNSSIELREDICDQSRNRVYFNEAYIKIPLNNMDISIGKQIIKWGQADGINPTNNINPVDYSDFLDTEDETIGTYSALVKYYFKKIVFEAIFTPISSYNIVPLQNNRWYPNMPNYSAHPLIPDTIIALNYSFEEVKPETSVKNAEFAFKTSFSVQNIDFSISYFNGYDHLPYTNSKITDINTEQMEILILSKYYRNQIIGIDFSKIFNGFGLRGEGALIIPQKSNNDTLIDDNFVKYIVGIDKNIGLGKNNFSIIMQYCQDISLENQKFEKNDFRHIFQNSFIMNTSFEFGVKFSFGIIGVYNINSEDYYFQPKVEYFVMDGLVLTGFVDILHGNQSSFFGSYKNNDRIQIKLKYCF